MSKNDDIADAEFEVIERGWFKKSLDFIVWLLLWPFKKLTIFFKSPRFKKFTGSLKKNLKMLIKATRNFLVWLLLWPFKKLVSFFRSPRLKKSAESLVKNPKRKRGVIIAGLIGVGMVFLLVIVIQIAISSANNVDFTSPTWLTWTNVRFGLLALVLLIVLFGLWKKFRGKSWSTTSTSQPVQTAKTGGGFKGAVTGLGTGLAYIMGLIFIFALASMVLYLGATYLMNRPGPSYMSNRGKASVPVIPASYSEGARPFHNVPRFVGHRGDNIPDESARVIEEKFARFGDSVVTLFKDIAYAESGGNQFDPNDPTEVLKGRVNPRDLGLFQINESYHGATCTNAGYNIRTIGGNTDCAVLLFNRRGTTSDWCASAWSWRDHYESRPEGWRCDRTPDQLLRAANNPSSADTIVFEAPSDGSWSIPVYTDDKKLHIVADRGASFEAQTERGEVVRIDPCVSVTLSRNPVYLKIRRVPEDSSEQALTMIAIRHQHLTFPAVRCEK